MDEAVSETLGDVKSENTPLVTLEKEVKFGESVKTAANNETFQVLLNVGSSLIHGGLDILILIKLGHKINFHACSIVYLRLKRE